MLLETYDDTEEEEILNTFQQGKDAPPPQRPAPDLYHVFYREKNWERLRLGAPKWLAAPRYRKVLPAYVYQP